MVFDAMKGLFEMGQGAVQSAYNTAENAVRSVAENVFGLPSSSDSSSQVNDSSDPPEASVIEEAPEVVLRDPNNSLWQELHLLKVEAMANAEKKVRTSYQNVKELSDKNRAMTALLQHVTANSSEDGTYEAKDDQAKNLLASAIDAGLIGTKDKHSFTKDEKDALVRNIELQNRNLETLIKLATNEVQEGLHTRNTYYQELKTMWDKIIEACRKILQGISPR